MLTMQAILHEQRDGWMALRALRCAVVLWGRSSLVFGWGIWHQFILRARKHHTEALLVNIFHETEELACRWLPQVPCPTKALPTWKESGIMSCEGAMSDLRPTVWTRACTLQRKP